MPIVNERCKILRSLNRVYVFEIVLLFVPRLKILRRRGLSYFGIFEKHRGTVEFPRNKPQQFMVYRCTSLQPNVYRRGLQIRIPIVYS